MQGKAKPKTNYIDYSQTSGRINTDVRRRRAVFPDDHGQHPPCTLINNSKGLDESDQQHKTLAQLVTCVLWNAEHSPKATPVNVLLAI
jgi:hypothetical protein